MKVIVIIPAAGLGTRMASSTATAQGRTRSKQFAQLEGVPILIHTLRKFTRMQEISEIWVAMRKSESELFREEARKYDLGHKVHIVEGGEHRQQSVANALNALHAAEDDIVLVHDAVRPFVTSETIAAVIAAVKKHGAAIAGVPAVDTIKQVERTADGAVITATIPREMIVQAQTPQGFRFAILKQAFDDATAEGFLGTDEASLLERLGQPVHVVMGSVNNIKITTPADLELAEFFISLENRGKASISG
ncbi:MAG: 2-C-methyl-D-erythritol 4-phosphate cytidylyltransferase [Candidatus Korobacteraceae bacterium]